MDNKLLDQTKPVYDTQKEDEPFFVYLVHRLPVLSGRKKRFDLALTTWLVVHISLAVTFSSDQLEEWI